MMDLDRILAAFDPWDHIQITDIRKFARGWTYEQVGQLARGLLQRGWRPIRIPPNRMCWVKPKPIPSLNRELELA